MTVHSACRGREKVCVGAATVLPLHGRGGTGEKAGLCPILYHRSPLVVGNGHMWLQTLRRKRDTGTVRVVLVRWEMGKQGEGKELSILFLCPREYLRTRFGLCVPFSHLSLRAVWCTGTCRPPPATPAPAVCGRCERFAASPSPRLQSRNARGPERGASAPAGHSGGTKRSRK